MAEAPFSSSQNKDMAEAPFSSSQDIDMAEEAQVSPSKSRAMVEDQAQHLRSHALALSTMMARREEEEEEAHHGKQLQRESKKAWALVVVEACSSQSWRPLWVLALGQFLSFLITATGVASAHLASLGIHAPTTQSLCNYTLLALVYGPLVLYRRRKLKVPWYCYALLAIVDVEANYLAVKAYQYTTITSVLLLDRGSLLFVLALTWIILKTKYNLGQIGGVIMCMGGVVILFLSDAQPPKKNDAKEMINGDILVLLSSSLYAISNVIEELLSRKNDFVELMALLGFFGSIFSACQLCILELHEIKSIKWNLYEILPFIGYAASLFTFYIVVPVFLKVNGSTMLNLSLITSDMWAILFQNFLWHQKIRTLYFVSFSVVALGLIIYSFFSRSQGLQDSSRDASSESLQFS